MGSGALIFNETKRKEYECGMCVKNDDSEWKKEENEAKWNIKCFSDRERENMLEKVQKYKLGIWERRQIG